MSHYRLLGDTETEVSGSSSSALKLGPAPQGRSATALPLTEGQAEGKDKIEGSKFAVQVEHKT